MSAALLVGRGAQAERCRAPRHKWHPCTQSQHMSMCNVIPLTLKCLSKVRGCSSFPSFYKLAKGRTLHRPMETITSTTLQTSGSA